MARFETSTAIQIKAIVSGISPKPMTGKKAADRDYNLADQLDKKGDEYAAAGNHKMAAICRERALAACIRADKHN